MATPEGGWTGASLGMLAAQFVKKEKEPVNPVRVTVCESCSLRESRYKALEESLSRMNAVIDDQAAQIIDLQAKLGLGSQSDGAREEMIRKLQKNDDTQRRNISHSERRVLQLIEKLHEHEIPIPGDTYERWEKLEPGDGTGLGAPASNQ